MPLSTRNRTLLNQACPTSVEAAFIEVSSNWSQRCWLVPKNRYKKNCINKIEQDMQQGGIVHRHLREYIASSAVVHCMDGWSYLGRGIEAHLKGDPHISRHLGYYAELRAALGLLAAEGIGVFDKTHFVIDSQKKCRNSVTHSATHEFAWDALEHWAQTASAASLLYKIIKPGGLSLEEWLNRFSITPGFRMILAEKWLRHWGLDLEQLRNDRRARNTSSYRPTAFLNVKALNIEDALRFVKNFWDVCEPSETIRFPKLDRHLLRNSLEILFKSLHTTNRSRNQAKRIFKRQVKSMLHGLTPGDLTADQWERFLNFDDSPDLPTILKEARATDKPSSPRHHLQVLARATLLLRVATGASYERLSTLPVFNASHLEFWSKMLGEDRGLWHVDDPPERFIDLWTDINEAIEALNGWQATLSETEMSYNKMWRDQPGASAMLGSCERVGLWGLGL